MCRSKPVVRRAVGVSVDQGGGAGLHEYFDGRLRVNISVGRIGLLSRFALVSYVASDASPHAEGLGQKLGLPGCAAHCFAKGDVRRIVKAEGVTMACVSGIAVEDRCAADGPDVPGEEQGPWAHDVERASCSERRRHLARVGQVGVSVEPGPPTDP